MDLMAGGRGAAGGRACRWEETTRALALLQQEAARVSPVLHAGAAGQQLR